LTSGRLAADSGYSPSRPTDDENLRTGGGNAPAAVIEPLDVKSSGEKIGRVRAPMLLGSQSWSISDSE
jgi:hypothetical protein